MVRLHGYGIVVAWVGLGLGLGLAVTGCGDDGSGGSDSQGGDSSSVTASESESATASGGTMGEESASAGGSASDSASAGGTTTAGSTGGETETTTADTGETSPGSTGSTESTGSTGDTTGVMTTGSTTADLPPGICGDGELNAGEECDLGEGNGEMSDCTADCTLNPCGDGYVASHEACDLGEENGPESGCSETCEILPSSCGNQTAEAKLVPKPVDIIIVIDNSGSMGQEIKGVEENINANFAAILDASELDYRVIMVSRYGKHSSYRICVEAPLGGIPKGNCLNPPPQPVNNPGKFYHYSVAISSTNAWCRLLQTFDGAVKDEYNFAPTGWRTWLREDSFKAFLVISDDRAGCSPYNDGNTAAAGLTAATNYDLALFAKSPLHFGAAPASRNYAWYSLVGVAANNPPENPYLPEDPVVTSKCNTAVNPAYGHQQLSKLSGGLRAPLCDTTKYDALFHGIANQVVSDAKLACEFAIPEAPEDKSLDLDSVVVDFTPQGQDPISLKKVDGPDQCDAMSFYLDLDEGLVQLCPEACALVQNDTDATLEVDFTCEPLMPG